MKMLSTREAYGLAIEALGEYYDFFVLDADLSKATKTDLFAKKYPGRFFDMGISECDMICTAVGLATCGVPAFASTFAAFAAGRAYDQIRNSVAYPQINVKIAATHAGVLIGPDGGSHQCIEDIALMRVLPNMTVICPSDPTQTKAAIEAVILHKGPVYLRFGRMETPYIYDSEKTFEFEIGKGYEVRHGKDVTIIAVGDMVYESLRAAELLDGQGISARVIDMATIKPIDKDIIIKSARETGAVVTAEDHNIIGGLGSAVAEVLSESIPVPLIRTGVKDVFGRSGSRQELAEAYGLNGETIAQAVDKVIKLK
ncbi:MAG: transketolase [Clostridia bacterium BRH_c25]|nr:MAG: transketolase [Clostridia bacterium BRH_c25]